MPEVREALRVRALGAKAAQALRTCGGLVAPVPEFASAPYRLAAGEIVWVGATGPMHPRAVFADDAPLDMHLDAGDAAVWTPPSPDLAAVERAALQRAMASLLPAVSALAGEDGFAPLLSGRRPAFPLAARSDDAQRAGAAGRAGDAHQFARSAARLIGAGGGLTPSGDDFTGGALFALAHLRGQEPAWIACAASICALARARTHRISAALLSDLAAGASFASLHALVGAAGRRAGVATLIGHVQDIASIGHSSGWDMLTGLIAVTAGLPGIEPST